MGADFLMFWPQSQPIPANLITLTNGAPVASKGVNYGIQYGFRLDLGLWLNSEESLGAQSLVDQLFRKTVTVSPAGTVNLNTFVGGAPTALPVTGLNFQSWTQYNRVDGSTLFRIRCNDRMRIYGIIGTKFVVMEEDVSFNYNFAGGPVFEDFHTRNNFYGGQVGVLVTYSAGRIDLDGAAKVGLGADYYNTTILGRNASNLPTQAFTNDANIGFYENTVFSAVPEFNGNVNYRLTDRISLRAGYTVLFFTNMQRPGAQIVQNIAPGLASPHTGPRFPGIRDTFIMNGLNFGAILRY